MNQTTEASAPPASVPSIPIQPRDSFVCPSWCVETHTEVDLYPWEYGQWTVRHEGRPHTWLTARGTEMEAHLEWTEVVGSSAILVSDGAFDSSGPLIELGGDDGSGRMGTNQISACDVAEWARVLTAIAAEVA